MKQEAKEDEILFLKTYKKSRGSPLSQLPTIVG